MRPLTGSPAGPQWKDACHQSLLHNLQGPQWRSPPSMFPSQSTHREKCPVPRASFQPSLKSSRWTDPCGERCPSPESSQVPGRQASCQIPRQGPHEEWCPSESSSPYPSRSPEKEPTPTRFPNRAPTERDAPSLEPSNSLLKFPVNRLHPGSPTERHPSPELSSTHSVVIHLSLKVPSKWAALLVPQQGPCGERCFFSRANGLFIYIHQSSQLRSPPTKNWENVRSPSTEPHAEGRATYTGMRPGSPRGSFTTLQSLPSAMQPSARYLPPWLR